jgi:hypothetical protein
LDLPELNLLSVFIYTLLNQHSIFFLLADSTAIRVKFLPHW